jgi:hypothetical protein
MSLRYLDFVDFLTENLGRILIAFGIVSLVFGILSLTTIFTLVPAVALFLGLVLTAYGFLFQLGFFSVRWRSISGFGTVLLCVSVVFFSLAFVAIQFQDISSFLVREEFSRAGEVLNILGIPIGVRPFFFIFNYGFQLGAVLFAAGLTLKVVGAWRH